MSALQPAPREQVYRYNSWMTLYLYVVTGVVWLLTVVVVGVSEHIGSFLMATLVCICAILFTRACLGRATITLNEKGVSARLLGIQTRFIGWRAVTKIVKSRVPSGYGFYSDIFQVYAEDHGVLCRFLLNICGNIAFDERIAGLRPLLDQINVHAREYAIPLFVWDLEAIAKQRPLIKPKSERGRRSEVSTLQF